MSVVVTLESLCGLRHLDARGEFVGVRSSTYDDRALVVLLRLDGVVYWFQEDPDDGYRSMLSHVRTANPDELPPGCLSEFPSRLVSLAVRTELYDYGTRAEILMGTDEATGTVLFEIGTDNLDDYYPSFVSRWTPPPVLA